MKRIKDLSVYVTLKQTAPEILLPKKYPLYSDERQLSRHTLLSTSQQKILSTLKQDRRTVTFDNHSLPILEKMQHPNN